MTQDQAIAALARAGLLVGASIEYDCTDADRQLRAHNDLVYAQAERQRQALHKRRWGW
ncbi:MAG TPA: hypothetical protein VG435_09830 [Acidimicrobiales bacterium]|jgi:hypothetical protein|nr:hypothetical protein [Acidimicrobiales bacterium]